MKKILATTAALLFATSIFAQDEEQVSDDDFVSQEVDQYSAEENSQESSEEPQNTVQEEPAQSVSDDSQNYIQEDTQTAYQNNSAKGSSYGIGIRAAFDYGMMYGFEEGADNDSDFDGDPSGIGFEAGIAARITLTGSVSFSPEINFAYVSTSHKYVSNERKYTSMDIEIPLMIRGMVADRFYVAAGPQININISNKVDIEVQDMNLGGGIVIKNEFEEKFDQAGFTFGLAAGAGVRIIDNFFFDFRFYMGLMDLYPDVAYIGDEDWVPEDGNWSSIDMSGAKMMKIKAGFSYWFM